MSLDFYLLTQLKKNHPAWRLLQADHAPLIASFLDKVFIQTNERIMIQADLVAKLEDTLFQLHDEGGEQQFPRSAQAYLDEWSQNDKGWLRKFYPQDSDDPHYDLTPATEKALVWLESLAERRFVGTESRLLMVFELLRQMINGTETNAEVRIAELEKRKQDIEREIAGIKAGEIKLMDDSALKDRFLQVSMTARELLSDFRAVEHNFRQLDRGVREQIASWDGRKGQLLSKIFGERDAIADSDQGRSFRAFWDFLMSPASQEELSTLLDQVFELSSLTEYTKDKRLQRIHFDWLEAGEYTQRTVAKLSQQLRRYLDDQTYLENKRIMQLLDGVNLYALQIRHNPPKDMIMSLDEPSPTIQLPMDRPLFRPPVKVMLQTQLLVGNADELVPEALFNQIVINKDQLISNINRTRGLQQQTTLMHVIEQYPIHQGLAELIVYLTIAAADKHAVFDESQFETIAWLDNLGVSRQASLPRIIFSRV
ncbi:MAG: DUF3375 domain-containing protein [Tatlockia sp.]|nr:DUF3375 domain-containing protein [Tatlockia sp.]